ncbi:ABC transporter ATP-binding protein [Clostridium sporogenes]|uniref:Antibiotic ABC transporter ATP-binding protein n=2 Tax=Clostridium TaxID=1485 RepID=A0A0D1BSU8_CLOBO|nr:MULTISPECIES: ABC transporter ATP-binding protein [Clostridium]MBE6076436.1 ABC transporter ATP-binding protein [Clostridium lundense]MDU2833310.1 ABC transporter ATP-binding protein [Clostridium botulinum]KIS23395.1 antibiotic ABC transporter ATP-binding protein [Clostridium botulinum B2 450]MCW6095543.1 ABC transporter ATP-binding protein [Clostridium sporogenes]MCW7999223.1 ABC transporter ATP-binding protein [Clostridium sp. cpc1]
MSIIEVNNVTKRFNDKLVLDNINFRIQEGEIFGLIGPNGAGKSTLINIITSILKSTSGDIKIGGYSITKEALKAKEYIGLVPQEIALIETVSAIDNLEFFGSLYGLKGKLLKERIDEALEVIGLKEKRREKVKKFSGGMKRRLNIAAAIMHHPKILIMDEPTVGIDPQSRNHIFEFTRKINREEKTTVIYTSHYMEEVEMLCNNLFIMDLGKEVAYGNKNYIKSMVGDKNRVILKLENYTGETLLNIRSLEGVVECEEEGRIIKLLVREKNFELNSLLKILENENIEIKGINFEEPTLEEVFLALTGKKLRG